MRCPFCNSPETQVKDSRPAEDNTAIRRRRICQTCGARYTTFERIYLRDIQVVKRDEGRERFDREKLRRSIEIALQKRPIDAERIDRMVSSIQRRLESSGDAEVQTNRIGELVMLSLAGVDPVGYVRYASVYRDFKDASDFARFIESQRLSAPEIDEVLTGDDTDNADDDTASLL